MKHGSLFTNIGGFDLAADWMGWETVFHCEINKFGKRILKYYWPDADPIDDIKQTDFSIYRGRIDVLSGGDPCQRNSNANRSGEKVAESLGGEYIRVVSQIMPRWIIRENPATIRKDAPWPAWRFAAELENLGYVVPTPFKLRACCTGARIRRERLFVLGYLPCSDSEGLEGNERKEMEGSKQRRSNANSPGPTWLHAPPRFSLNLIGFPENWTELPFLNGENSH